MFSSKIAPPSTSFITVNQARAMNAACTTTPIAMSPANARYVDRIGRYLSRSIWANEWLRILGMYLVIVNLLRL